MKRDCIKLTKHNIKIHKNTLFFLQNIDIKQLFLYNISSCIIPTEGKHMRGEGNQNGRN